jgi:hypothetical protein
MKKYFAILVLGAIASIGVVQAGEDCSATAKKDAAACATEKVAAKTSCCPEEAATTAKVKTKKALKRIQATAKGAYRG